MRQRAEAEIKAETLEPEAMSQEECIRLIHELRVHQIELEMQNEELRQAQAQLAESRDKYADLYDFAPVGYLTLDERGLIVEANLTAAALLGMERGRLLGLSFPLFLVEADRPVFRQLLTNSLPVAAATTAVLLPKLQWRRAHHSPELHVGEGRPGPRASPSRHDRCE